MDLIRKNLEESKIEELIQNEAVVDGVNAYFERRDDHTQIRDGVKVHYGLGISSSPDPANASNAPIEVYTKTGFTTMVDAGMTEAISTGFGQKVVGALSTLFTEDGQRFELDCEGKEDTEDELEFINGHREAGGLLTALVQSDRTSNQCGSAAILVSYAGGALQYQSISPAAIRVYFPDLIIEDGVERGVNKDDLEDAYGIVIRRAQIDMLTYSYTAIFGRSEKYPDGRWVDYTATSADTALPDDNIDDAIEYLIDGKIANPLSYYANQTSDKDIYIPDYPLAVIKGIGKDTSTPLPVTTSLYADSIEFDIGGSHTYSASNEAARGLTVVSMDQMGATQPLPRTLNGAIALRPGLEAEHISKNAVDAKTAFETQNMIMVACALGYSVPDYMVVSEDHALEAQSGVALQVKTRPLVKNREYREELNSPQVSKIFAIEKGLLNLHDESPESQSLLPCSMKWTAGALSLPENKKEKAERILSMMEKGVIDIISAIREYYNLATDDDAIQMYETMDARRGEHKPFVEEEKEVKTPKGLVNRRPANAI